MATLTIRNVDDLTKRALRVRAAQKGVSMEEEARRILREALAGAGGNVPMGKRLAERFSGVASADFRLPKRHVPRQPPGWVDEP